MLFAVLVVVLPLLTDAGYHRFLRYDNKDTEECRCVPERLCEDDNVLVNGQGLLDPRISHIPCKDPEQICCDNVKSTEDYDDEGDDEDIDNDINPAKESSIILNYCGVSTTSNVHSRILGSSESSTPKFGELPWNLIVQEYMDGKTKNIYRCGASLIHPKVAMTAAHCVSPYLEEPEKVVVRAGEWDSNSKNEPLPYQDRFVDEIIVHPNYNSLSLKNDIAIIILAEEFVLAENVGLICLPTPEKKILERNCVASGWGKDGYKTGRYSSILKKVEIPIVSRNKCLQSLRSTRLGKYFNLHRSFICAGGEKDKDACKGDGGSPLICPILGQTDTFVQMGIVSWGIGCGTDGIPGVYVNVPLYLDWIDNELSDKDIDTSLYRP